MKKENKKNHVATCLDDKLFRRVESFARKRNLTFSAAIRELLDEHLPKLGRRKVW